MAKIAIHNYSKYIKLIHDTGHVELIPKNYGKFVYNSSEDAIYHSIYGKDDLIIRKYPKQIKSITDHVLGSTPTVGATVKAIFDQIETFFF